MLSACGITEYWCRVPSVHYTDNKDNAELWSSLSSNLSPPPPLQPSVTLSSSSSPVEQQLSLGFSGSIKHKAEDFKVVEVDLDGQRTDLNSNVYMFREHRRVSERAAAAAQRDVQDSRSINTDDDDNGCLTTEEVNEDALLLEGKVDNEEDGEMCEVEVPMYKNVVELLQSHLSSILSTLGSVEALNDRIERDLKGQEDSLTLFLESVSGEKRKNDPSGSKNDAKRNPWWEQEYSLGYVGGVSRETRKQFHFLVNNYFLHIRSCTRDISPGAKVTAKMCHSKDTDVDTQEYFLTFNKDYIFFVLLFGAKVAERLMTWRQYDQCLRFSSSSATVSDKNPPHHAGETEAWEEIRLFLFPPNQINVQNLTKSISSCAGNSDHSVKEEDSQEPAKTEVKLMAKHTHDGTSHKVESAEDFFLRGIATSKTNNAVSTDAHSHKSDPQIRHTAEEIASSHSQGAMVSDAVRSNPSSPVRKVVPGESMNATFMNPFADGGPSDKDLRRVFHMFVRKYYNNLFKCQVNDGEVSFKLLSRPADKSSKNNSAHHGRGDALSGGKRAREADNNDHESTSNVVEDTDNKYFYFIIKKYNLETFEMRALLSEHFQLKSDNLLCLAGLKDKKAVTWQRASLPLRASKETMRFFHNCATLMSDKSEHGNKEVKQDDLLEIRSPNDPQNSYVAITNVSSSGSKDPKVNNTTMMDSDQAHSATSNATLFSAPINIGDLLGNAFVVKVRDIVSHGAELALHPPLPTLERVLKERLRYVTEHGFINYFGQQRFSEQATDLATSHVGVFLLRRLYAEAVESLYPPANSNSNSSSGDGTRVDLAELFHHHFPEKMEVRYIPAGLKDAQQMTRALKQSYNMFFKHRGQPNGGNSNTLTNEDVRLKSTLWREVCEKAITDGVPFHLRTLWIHAAQSLYFNLTASALCRLLRNRTEYSEKIDMPELLDLKLPLGGHMNATLHPSCTSNPTLQKLVELAMDEALTALHLTKEDLFGQKKVAGGVPLAGGWRPFLARPQDASVIVEKNESTDRGVATFAFYLPSSCYATVLLREVLGTDQWW